MYVCVISHSAFIPAPIQTGLRIYSRKQYPFKVLGTNNRLNHFNLDFRIAEKQLD